MSRLEISVRPFQSLGSHARTHRHDGRPLGRGYSCNCGVVVGLPPTVLVLVQYIKRRRYRRRLNRAEVLPRIISRLRPPPHHLSRQLSYTVGGTPNAEPPYGFVEAQYPLSHTVTFRRASPCHSLNDRVGEKGISYDRREVRHEKSVSHSSYRMNRSMCRLTFML
ncbi:hypothetical protein GGR51DRAFT_347139 [Nemania sp. FL0031]|nr:hypothetical protein GGR51DRAFT_347139 [Nemania sp. FL0031]